MAGFKWLLSFERQDRNADRRAIGPRQVRLHEREGPLREDGEELEYKESGNMPEWAEDDPQKYWTAADAGERANGRLYREVEFRPAA